MSIVTDAIYKYAKENHIPMDDGEKYGAIHDRIIESNLKLHSRDELKKYAIELLDKLLKEFDFKAVRVFAYYPLIATKEYIGFEEVYLYEHIHAAMGCTAQSFCKLNQINEKLDKTILKYEFKKAYDKRFGFFKLGSLTNDVGDLIHFMHLVHDHCFNKEYIKVLEEDIKFTLHQVGDNYFHHMDLTDEDNIRLLYDVCGVSYGFYGYRLDLFKKYDGYGNLVDSI